MNGEQGVFFLTAEAHGDFGAWRGIFQCVVEQYREELSECLRIAAHGQCRGNVQREGELSLKGECREGKCRGLDQGRERELRFAAAVFWRPPWREIRGAR